MKILFCNIGWMRDYDGNVGDSIARGGSYILNGEVGHEVCNFSNNKGMVYGYVQPSGAKLSIEKLGAGKKDSSISGVTVVWTAGPDGGGTAVVGWYKEATVFREAQAIPKPSKKQIENELEVFWISAKYENATLLPIEERTLLIPRAVKGGIGQSNVWYADSTEAQVHVKRVLKLIETGEDEKLLDVDGDLSGKEGNPRFVAHLRRERNSKIVKQKKAAILRETGALRCEVCKFDFKSFYGKLGSDFCEVHHLLQLSKADGLVKTKLDDLAVVCSNCHRIIHKHDPMLSLNQLKKVIRNP
ncbi:MAG: HNH endonuclease [Candidatus Lambdaproteobacteria bacterium RIFOXYD2_FULL_50_16]|uniref:HNH endonuclease n=1 Tax=Candidatus Lambdaproteobacteria bacterium RIFOXYD2_FULL_50_16 TaxID=1817772 RepID=A0A1F6G6A3_9PROT|nr:MAG: HNH endonuclease [Candidatus Lambdaproteobacteria bacterium RIFOXYD2_FULL_50_16]